MTKHKGLYRLWISSAFVMLMCLVASSNAAQIDASQKNGKLRFAGEHAGMSFDGVFEDWQASLVLPPNEQAKIQASFDLSSAKTGDSTYDSTLPEGDWFDVENHPTGKFVSTNIVANASGYNVTGELTLRGKSLPVEFVLENNADSLHAEFAIDRIAYGIGLDSDPEAEWVSRNIAMTLHIDL